MVQSYVATETDYQEVFKSWSAAYNKKYTDAEFQDAYLKWKTNFLNTNQHNQKSNNIPDAVVNANPSSISFSLESGNSVAEVAPTITYPKLDAQLSSVNYFSDMSYSEFISVFSGAAPEITAAAAGLAASTIAAIAVGGAVVVGAGVAATTVIVKRNRAKRAQPEVEMQGKEISNPTPIPAGSTNVFNMEPPHHSITARMFTGNK